MHQMDVLISSALKFTRIDLIKHPFETNCSCAFILGSTTSVIKVVHIIKFAQNCRQVLVSLSSSEDLPMRTDIRMVVEKSFKPTTSRPLHWEDDKIVHWCACAFFPAICSKFMFYAKYNKPWKFNIDLNKNLYEMICFLAIKDHKPKGRNYLLGLG